MLHNLTCLSYAVYHSLNDKNLHAEMNELSQKRGRDAHLNWAVETSRATLLGLGLGAFNIPGTIPYCMHET